MGGYDMVIACFAILWFALGVACYILGDDLD